MKPAMKIIATLCIALFWLTGCSKGTLHLKSELAEEFSDTGGLSLPLTKEPKKIKFFTALQSDVDQSADKMSKKLFAKTVKDLTNVELEYIISDGVNVKDKLLTMFASKTLPDISDQAFAIEDLKNLASNGLIASFDEHLDIMPNLSNFYKGDLKYQAAMDTLKAKLGKHYVVLSYDLARDINHGFMYRKDIFDKHGIPPWKDTQGFLYSLRRLKELYPNSDPFVSKRQFTIFRDLSIGWGLNGTDFYYDKESKKNLYGPTQPKFREFLDFFKKLYNEKLIDPQFLTATQTSWERKMIVGNEAFVTYDWIDRMDQFFEEAKENNPEYDLRFAFPIGPAGVYQRPDQYGTISVFVTNNENKEISMKLLDFFLSPAGSRLVSLGVPGTSYEIGEDGKVKYLGFDSDDYVNITSLEEKYGLFNQTFSLRFDKRSIYYDYTPRAQEAQELVKKHSLLADPFLPTRQIHDGKAGMYEQIKNNLQSEVELFIGKYILGDEPSEKVWADWLKKAKEIGVDTLTNLYNM